MAISDDIVEGIIAAFIAKLPLALDFQETPTSQNGLSFRLMHGDKTSGFIVNGEIGWKSLSLSFCPQEFSGGIVRHLEQLSKERLVALQEPLNKILNLGGKIFVETDGASIELNKLEIWPKLGRSLEIRAEFGPIEVRNSSNKPDKKIVETLIATFASLLAALLPLEVIDDTIEEADHLIGLPEGARISIYVNRYERSRANRDACIRYNGTRCRVCQFDFGSIYGPMGAGYIEVHHLTPVSSFGISRSVDPRHDLVPLCANCHAMVHRRNPPYTPDELRELLYKVKID